VAQGVGPEFKPKMKTQLNNLRDTAKAVLRKIYVLEWSHQKIREILAKQSDDVPQTLRKIGKNQSPK
jgi:DNA-directed RNA polymerase specialized sigma24 family protein